MVRGNQRNFQKIAVGDNVKVKVPNVDKSRLDFPNLICVVLEINQEKELYRLATKEGELPNWYTRVEISKCTQNHLLRDDVSNEKIPLREIVSKSSAYGGQGFLRCDCKQGCKTTRCNCKKNKVLCNSRCHLSISTCCNKLED